MEAKQIKIINQARYHYHDIISLKHFESKFSKIHRKQALIKRIDNFERICSVIAPFHWIVSFASGYIEERGRNKYLILDNPIAENKELLKKYTEFWDVVKHKIKKINGGKETDYRKDYIKIKFESSDDDLLLNESLLFYEMHIFVRFVFKEDDKLYPELSLDKNLCVKEIYKMTFAGNKTPIEVIRVGAFGDTYFRNICSSINRKWYKNSWKEFDQLKNIDKKYYCSDYYDASVNKYGVKCKT